MNVSPTWNMCLYFHHDGVTTSKSFQNFSSFMVESTGFLIKDQYGPLTRCAKLRVAHAPGSRERFPRRRLERKLLVSDPGMHRGTCVTHVPWCMSGSLTRGDGENVPGIPGACATRNLTYLARGPLRRCDAFFGVSLDKPIWCHCNAVIMIERPQYII